MTDLLLSPPWWLYCSVIALGLILWVGGNKRTDNRGRWIGAVVIALGAIMAVMSFLIETDVQKCDRQSKELVQAVVDENWDRVQSLLAPNVSLSISTVSTLAHSRQEVLDISKEGVRRYGLKGASTTVQETKKQDYIITTTIQVFSTGDMDLGHPVPTKWQFEWEKSSDGHWAVTDIRALKIGTAEGADMGSFIPRRP